MSREQEFDGRELLNRQPQQQVRFPLGRLLATRGIVARVAIPEIFDAFTRHQCGDWGELEEEDRLENERSLKDGDRLLSVYHSTTRVRFYVITEADRSVTTALLPNEY